jgi:hypothetical protein
MQEPLLRRVRGLIDKRYFHILEPVNPEKPNVLAVLSVQVVPEISDALIIIPIDQQEDELAPIPDLHVSAIAGGVHPHAIVNVQALCPILRIEAEMSDNVQSPGRLATSLGMFWNFSVTAGHDSCTCSGVVGSRMPSL